MLKKIIAAAICGIAIASMSTHADAAGAAGFARGFAAVE
ncbi:transglutaminase-like cysteine peptidase, partial [Rhizobium sp. BR5]